MCADEPRRLSRGFWLLFAVCGLLIPDHATESQAAQPVQISWQSIAKSVEGRPIEIAQFGEGARGYLVIGPLHGDDREAYDLTARLAAHLSQSPSQLAGKRITVVRDPNPDGRNRGRLENARGVDLDRNFATAAWQRVSWGNHWVSGRAADSEPETRALASLVLILRPARIVHVRDDSRKVLGVARSPAGGTPVPRNRHALSVAGPSEEVAARISRDTGLALLSIEPAVHAGSLSRFAAIDRRIPMLTMWADGGNRIAADRESLFRALLMALDFEVVPATTASAETAPHAPAQGEPSAEPGIVRGLSVDHLLQGAPLAPVVSSRAAALRNAARVPQATDATASPAPSSAPPSAAVHPAVVTEKTERPAAAPIRPPEKPIPVPRDADLN